MNIKVLWIYWIFIVGLMIFTSCSNESDSNNEEVITESLDDNQEETENEEDSQSSTETFFTINVSNEVDTFSFDNWVLLYNSSGDLLDYKSYESGDNFVFETTSDELTDHLSVTFLRYSSESGNTTFSISTYTNISKGSTWYINPSRGQPNADVLSGEILGNITININGVVGPFVAEFSNAYKSLGNYQDSEGVGVPVNFSKDIVVHENSNEHLISIIDGNGEIKYITQTGWEVGDEITIEYSEFLPIDDKLEITIPENGSYVVIVNGFEEGQEFRVSPGNAGFVQTSIFPSQSEFVISNPISIGYLNRFENYLTSLRFDTGAYNYVNTTYGQKPDKIDIPENPEFNVMNSALNDFSFSTNHEFEYIINNWFVTQGERNVDLFRTSWTVYSPSNDQTVLGRIPEELENMYPQLNLDQLEYRSSTLQIGESYNDRIENRFISEEAYNPFVSSERLMFINQ